MALGHATVRCSSAMRTGGPLARCADEAVSAALAPLRGTVPDLAVVFGNGPDADELGAALARASQLSGATTSLGCTATAGLMAGPHANEDQPGVSVWLACLPGARLRAFHLEVMRTPQSIAVVGMPPAASDDRVGIVLADAWSFPVEGFVDQSAVAYPGLPLAGGLAAGAAGAGSTRLLVDGRVVDRGAVGVIVSGDVAVTTAVSQGCRPIGSPMTVTAADGNVISTLAGQPAVARMRQVISELPPGDQALASRGLQLGIARDEYVDDPDQGDYVVRGLLGADEPSGALLVGDSVEVGQTVCFQLRDDAAAQADLVTTLGDLRAALPPEDVTGVLLFSCNGRGSALFADAAHDALTVSGAFPGASVAGYFAAGEVGPVAGRNFVHGFTASLVVVAATMGGESHDC